MKNHLRLPSPQLPDVLLLLFLLLTLAGGSAARADGPVLYGRFTAYIEGVEVDRQLIKLNNDPILKSEVPALYGTADGMTVYDDGVDVCSWEYAALKGLPEPLQPAGMDLSDSAGWPDIHIPPGTLAVDPYLGRFFLAEGDSDPSSIAGSAWTGFGVPGSGFIEIQGDYAYLPAGEGEIQVIDISDPAAPIITDTAYGDFNYGLAPYGHYLYHYRNNRGMSAIDISDPTDLDWYPDEALSRVWEAPGNQRMSFIEIQGSTAFATLGQEPGFYSLDLTDPLNAVVLDSINVGDPEGAQWLFLSGDRAYVGLGSANGLLDGATPYTHRWSAGFAVIDISDPTDLTVLGTYPGDPSDDIYTVPRMLGISGDMVIMAVKWRPGNYPPAQAAKLVLVDASDPANITRRGEYEFLDGLENESHLDLYSAAAYGDYIYISDNSYDSTGDSLSLGDGEDYTTLFTFDISDPDNPALDDRYDQPQPSRFRHLTRSGDLLFIHDYNIGMRIFSLADPTDPSPVSSLVTAAEGRFAWVNEVGTHAYNTGTYGGSIHTIDILSPSAPTLQSTYWDGQWNEKQRPAGRGDALYIPTMTQISILDVSDPANPLKIGSFPSAITHSTLSVFGDYAYALTMADGSSPIRGMLRIYDLTNPLLPTLQGSLDLGERHEGLFAQGDYAYAAGNGVLKIIDVSDGTSPSLLGELEDINLTLTTRDEAGRMWVRGSCAYIITGERDEDLFHIVDISDPAAPSYVSTFTYDPGSGPESHHVTDIVISGKYLYLGTYWHSFLIFDITIPTAPVFVESGSALPLGVEGWPASWSLGRLSGEYLVLPTISHLHLVDVPRDSQALAGTVTVSANLGEPTAVGLRAFSARSGKTNLQVETLLIIIGISILLSIPLVPLLRSVVSSMRVRRL